jgi:hypothetical protein
MIVSKCSALHLGKFNTLSIKLKRFVRSMACLGDGSLAVRDDGVGGKCLVARRVFHKGDVATAYCGTVRYIDSLTVSDDRSYMRIKPLTHNMEVIDGQSIAAAFTSKEDENWLPDKDHHMYDDIMYGGVGAMIQDNCGYQPRGNVKQVTIEVNKLGDTCLFYEVTVDIPKDKPFFISYRNSESRRKFKSGKAPHSVFFFSRRTTIRQILMCITNDSYFVTYSNCYQPISQSMNQ